MSLSLKLRKKVKRQEKKRENDLQWEKTENYDTRTLKRLAVMKLIFNCTSYAIWEIFSFILDFLFSFRAICMLNIHFYR